MSDSDKKQESGAPSSTEEVDFAAPHNFPVGYKKPPVHSRFKPGQSGNRKGRPKGASSSKSLFRKVMNEKLTISDNGRRKKLPSAQLAFMALRNKALKGDHKAMQIMLGLMERWELDDLKNAGGVFRIEFVDSKVET